MQDGKADPVTFSHGQSWWKWYKVVEVTHKVVEVIGAHKNVWGNLVEKFQSNVKR